MIRKSALDILYTGQTSCRFIDVNDVLMHTVLSTSEIALIDMPEILLRMKVAHEHSLDDLKGIFNFVMNRVAR